jgi:hypothetical protein
MEYTKTGIMRIKGLKRKFLNIENSVKPSFHYSNFPVIFSFKASKIY